ncbi:hypothetical protein BGX28_004709 [Mortierella sp. GBA30]|nr:hypothetical protein BGX28_004709 [Mortierella sp. GBA30]
MALPPRRRLHHLKNSANFPAEEFQHSIKTWVNMASLLVKQGNMAESNKDDENAYISYMRACIIITKIIPHQSLYRNMMNDIVCIDLRQKILGIVSRMGHLERRLLKRFEEENEERAAQIARDNVVTSFGAPSHVGATSSVTITAASESSAAIMLPVHSSSIKVELPSEEEQLEKRDDSTDDDQEDDPNERTGFRQEGDEDDEDGEDDEEDDEGNYESKEYEESEELELQSGGPAGPELVDDDTTPELSPQIYSRYHHPNRRAVLFSRSRSASVSPYQQLDITSVDEALSKNHIRTAGNNDGGSESLKKTSNEDGRPPFLSSPACQPNYSAMPSALFARQREGCHVRRCSSTDNIRANAQFPTSFSSAPVIPPRSDKRRSMIVSTERSSTGLRSTVPDYRGTAASGAAVRPNVTGAIAAVTRVGFERDAFQKRFANRRTMSFESSHFKPILQVEAAKPYSASAKVNSPYIGTHTTAIRTIPSLRKCSSVSRINTSRNFTAESHSPYKPSLIERMSANPMNDGSPISGNSHSPPISSGASSMGMSMSLSSASASASGSTSVPFFSPPMKSSPQTKTSFGSSPIASYHQANGQGIDLVSFVNSCRGEDRGPATEDSLPAQDQRSDVRNRGNAQYTVADIVAHTAAVVFASSYPDATPSSIP